MDSMTKIIERIVKRADASAYAAMGPMFTNQLLEGAAGKTKGTWSSNPRTPRDESLSGVHPSLLSGKSPLRTDTLRRLDAQLSGPLEIGDLVLYALDSGYAYRTGEDNSDEILSGQFDLAKWTAYLSRQLSSRTVKDIHRKNKRDKGMSEYNEMDGPGVSEDMYGQSPFRGPGGWASGYGELFTELMNSRGSNGRVLRDAVEAAIGSLRPAQANAVKAVLDWLEANPGKVRNGGEPNFTDIGRKMNPPVSRQSVQKAWKAALAKLGQALKNNKRVVKILQEESHQLRAANFKARLAHCIKRGERLAGVVELSFTLSGVRVASADKQVDPRVHLANSPETLEWVLKAAAPTIEEVFPSTIEELVINENLAGTWKAKRNGFSTHFTVLVGIRG